MKNNILKQKKRYLLIDSFHDLKESLATSSLLVDEDLLSIFDKEDLKGMAIVPFALHLIFTDNKLIKGRLVCSTIMCDSYDDAMYLKRILNSNGVLFAPRYVKEDSGDE